MIVMQAVEEYQPNVAEVSSGLNEPILDGSVRKRAAKILPVIMIAEQKAVGDLQHAHDVSEGPVGVFIAAIRQIAGDDT